MGDKAARTPAMSLEFAFYGNYARADPAPLLSVLQAQLLGPDAAMEPMHDDFLYLPVAGGKMEIEVSAVRRGARRARRGRAARVLGAFAAPILTPFCTECVLRE